MLVSVAETNDSRQIRDLLLQMHSETEFYVSPVDMEKLTYHILSTIKNGCVFIVKNKNEIVGSIGGVIGGDWWSEELFLGDLWYYVKPSSRKSTAAIKLAKAFINYANCINMRVKLGHVYSGDIDRKDNFYERLGLVKTGSVFTGV